MSANTTIAITTAAALMFSISVAAGEPGISVTPRAMLQATGSPTQWSVTGPQSRTVMSSLGFEMFVVDAADTTSRVSELLQNAQPRVEGQPTFTLSVLGESALAPAQSTEPGILFQNVIDGVDAIYSSNLDGEVLAQLVLRPGAVPNRLRFWLAGQDGISIDDDGNLVISFGERRIVQSRPAAWQQTASTLRYVPASFRLSEDGRELSIILGRFAADQPVVVEIVTSYTPVVHGFGVGPHLTKLHRIMK